MAEETKPEPAPSQDTSLDTAAYTKDVRDKSAAVEICLDMVGSAKIMISNATKDFPCVLDEQKATPQELQKDIKEWGNNTFVESVKERPENRAVDKKDLTEMTACLDAAREQKAVLERALERDPDMAKAL